MQPGNAHNRIRWASTSASVMASDTWQDQEARIEVLEPEGLGKEARRDACRLLVGELTRNAQPSTYMWD